MGSSLGDFVAQLQRRRAPLAISFDICAWMAAYLVFAWLRFDTVHEQVPWVDVLAMGAANGLLFVALALFVRLHQGRAATASLEEIFLLALVTTASGGIVFVANLFSQVIPRSVPAGATLAALGLAVLGRAFWTGVVKKNRHRSSAGSVTRVLVIGAGEAGRELLGSMQRDPQRTWQPVGLLDDDSRKRHRRLRGVSVVGTTAQLPAQVRATGAQAVVIAIPSASSETVNRLRLAALKVDVPVKVLPATTQLLHDRVGIRDLRDINLTDVLGRNQLDTDIESIAEFLTGRRVLVTGAGGSIGSELCRQIHRFEPGELMMLDRDESALHAVQLSIYGRALLDSDDVILCDIRDATAVNAVFLQRRPDVVFHAAALKHLPMLEQYPAEAVKTNVLGTRTVLDAADLVGVERFVNISTDKAANPESVLGFSKRIAEQITAARADEATGTYLSVRFGNVLGSRGSVLASFAKQIASGGPLTVTHPDVTRYFMTIEEACQLVIQAAAIGSPGEALVLDMGEPVKIADVAQQLMEQAGTPVRIEYTGLRPGEKLHEELFGAAEPRHVRPVHDLVSHVPVPALSDEDIEVLPIGGDPVKVRRALAELCLPSHAAYSTQRSASPTYSSSRN